MKSVFENYCCRHRQHAREQFEATTREAMNMMPPPTPSYSQYFHGEKALGGGTATAFEATDPLLFVDVVLSGDRNKIRVPVCRGDSPKQVRSLENLNCPAHLKRGFREHALKESRAWAAGSI